MSGMFLLLNIAVLPLYLLIEPDNFTDEVLPLFLKLVPVLVLAIWLGSLAASKLNTKIYHRLVSVTIYFTAIMTISLGVIGLR